MKQKILTLLKDFEKEKVEQYANYISKLLSEKDKKTGGLKNTWIINKTPEELAELFRRVAKTGLSLDGVHITLQQTGIVYDYIAYKNKMLLAYPDTKMDFAVVVEGDGFSFSRENGKVNYEHIVNNPFQEKNVIGAFCVIKNKRGEFLTILNEEELAKHRKVAKTDFIWKEWYKEMVLKTVIKKGCKVHFDDVFTEIEEIDNENYDLDNLQKEDKAIKIQEEVQKITDIKELREYFQKKKGLGKEIEKIILDRSEELKGSENPEDYPLPDEPNENT